MTSFMFQRRHYRKIAETLASEKPSWEDGISDEWHTTCLAFVKLFQSDNRNFDREKFLVWCNTHAPKTY